MSVCRATHFRGGMHALLGAVFVAGRVEYPPDEIVHGAERISWLNLDGSIPIREFISPDAGQLQFGGLDPDAAASVAKSRFGGSKGP
jgi:hypothetical protein